MSNFLRTVVIAGFIASSLAGCVAPILMGGAFVGSFLVSIDRRTSGAQIEDQGIELRAASRLSDALGDRTHINVTSYNRQVLLTGEVPSEKDKAVAEQIVAKIENVRSTNNELGILGNTNLSARSADTLLTTRVKTALLEEKRLYGNAFKIVTERGVVYMMGRVTAGEADLATQIVRGQNGVQKVVCLLETISDEDLKQYLPPPAPAVEVKSTPVMSGSGQPITTSSPK